MDVKEEELKPGYNYDPYKGEESAPFFIGTFIAKFTGEKDGFISSYREWHIMLNGISDGLAAKTLDDFPKCPPLWVDEKPYYEIPGKIVNIIKCQWPTVAVIISAYAAKVGGIW